MNSGVFILHFQKFSVLPLRLPAMYAWNEFVKFLVYFHWCTNTLSIPKGNTFRCSFYQKTISTMTYDFRRSKYVGCHSGRTACQGFSQHVCPPPPFPLDRQNTSAALYQSTRDALGICPKKADIICQIKLFNLNFQLCFERAFSNNIYKNFRIFFSEVVT